LTDLEYRVWTQYLLSADDYGVMRFSAVTVQADNDALHAKPTRTVQRCLERLVDVGLLADFEHQKRKYLCQLDWQSWQRIKFPRHTNHPAPPAAVLGRCDETTVGLFLDHHPCRLEAPPIASSVEDDAHQGAPQVTAMANGNGYGNGLRESFSEFWRTYPRRVGKEAAWRAWQKAKPTRELLAQMAAALEWQCGQDAWTKDGGQFIPHPATWLNQQRWLDEPTTVRPAPTANKRVTGLMAGGQAFLNRRQA
jgi:hypothetical protein